MDKYNKLCYLTLPGRKGLVMRDRLEVRFFNGIYDVTRVCIRLDNCRFFIYDLYDDYETMTMEAIYNGDNKKTVLNFMQETENMTIEDEEVLMAWGFNYADCY